MRCFNTLQAKVSIKIIAVLSVLTVLTTQFAYAQEKMSKIDLFLGLQYGLSLLVPIAGAVILFFLLLIYAFRLISKATFLRWAFSVIMASAAFYISTILFHIT
ncbi:conjugal transfer protein [Bartonella phoceensis]|uniref:conjugal transfer protein n=1 Tax=Bartonella phoceensis TaxID=270249 RepID=UPI001ABB6AE3|nr:conjugal transfer protein [Bartonella phoceensis]